MKIFLREILHNPLLWLLAFVPVSERQWATVRAARGIDWHSDVRTLSGIFLRYSEQKILELHGR